MGTQNRRSRATQQLYDEIGRKLADSGYATSTVDAMMDFDFAMFGLKRSMVKGELPVQLMAELGTGLELGQFEALTAVIRLLNGFGGVAPQEATIGLVATELNIDPSRASRITADLIARGYLLREVSQTDGRKSVLALTEKAHELLKSFLDLKWTKSMQVFADWDEADIVTFSTLFVRYTAAMQAAYPGR